MPKRDIPSYNNSEIMIQSRISKPDTINKSNRSLYEYTGIFTNRKRRSFKQTRMEPGYV
jgi:hypothetical protein